MITILANIFKFQRQCFSLLKELNSIAASYGKQEAKLLGESIDFNPHLLKQYKRLCPTLSILNVSIRNAIDVVTYPLI
jgi:hypothetical protein